MSSPVVVMPLRSSTLFTARTAPAGELSAPTCNASSLPNSSASELSECRMVNAIISFNDAERTEQADGMPRNRALRYKSLNRDALFGQPLLEHQRRVTRRLHAQCRIRREHIRIGRTCPVPIPAAVHGHGAVGRSTGGPCRVRRCLAASGRCRTVCRHKPMSRR